MVEDVEGQSTASGSGAWSFDKTNLRVVAALLVAIVGLFAIAAAIDLGGLAAQDENAELSAELLDEILREGYIEGDTDRGFSAGPGAGGFGSGGFGFGSGRSGIEGFLDQGGFEPRPMPGCPGGFQLAPDVFMMPDPSACGFQPLQPGDRVDGPIGIIIVPSFDDPARFRFDGDELELLPPGSNLPSDLDVTPGDDGAYNLQGRDGSGLELVPDGEGNYSFGLPTLPDGTQLPNIGSFTPDDLDALFDAMEDAYRNGQPLPPLDEVPNAEPFEPRQPSSSSSDSSDSGGAAGPVALALLVIAVGALLIYAVVTITQRERRAPLLSLDEEEDADDGPPVSYEYELNALDRLLWEIDREKNPRRAIMAVFAALETGLGQPAMARRRSETPGRFVRRILGSFDELDAPLRELTRLFELARFSEHEITPAMRDRAVGVLHDVRGYYVSRDAAERQAAAERAAAAQADLVAEGSA